MKFGRKIHLLAVGRFVGRYIDYASLKLLAEPRHTTSADGGGDSDDSVSAAPRHAKHASAERARERASEAALEAAGGAAAAAADASTRFLALLDDQLSACASFYGEELAACRAAVDAAAASVHAALDAVDADRAASESGSSLPTAAPVLIILAPPPALVVGSASVRAAVPATPPTASALASAQASVLSASTVIADLRSFAELNVLALEKSAKKYDKHWRKALDGAVPSASASATRTSMSAIVAVRIAGSSIADAQPLLALSTRCSELSLSLPTVQRSAADAAVASAGSVSSPSSSAASGGSGALDAAGAPSASLGLPAALRSPPALVTSLALDTLPLGAITCLRLRLGSSSLDEPIAIPVMVARGRHAGPVLGITSALHGNELAGIPVIHRLFWDLDVSRLCGIVVAIPVVNVVGYTRHQRGFSDGADLNRIMPGKKGGSASQAFAYALVAKVIKHVDVLLDLHTASFGRVNSLYVRADMRDERTRRLALLQSPQVIVHNTGPDGSLRGACAALGKPAVTIEIGDPQVFLPHFTDIALRGALRTMVHLTMLPPPSPQHALTGGGGGDMSAGWAGAGEGGDCLAPEPTVCSRSFWLFSLTGGILTVKPPVAAWVKKGDTVAEVHSIWGSLLDAILAPCDGVIVGKSTNPVCATGDRILHLGVVEGSFPAHADDGHA